MIFTPIISSTLKNDAGTKYMTATFSRRGWLTVSEGSVHGQQTPKQEHHAKAQLLGLW